MIIIFTVFYIILVLLVTYVIYKDLDTLYKSKPKIVYNKKYRRFVRYYYNSNTGKWKPEFIRNGEKYEEIQL